MAWQIPETGLAEYGLAEYGLVNCGLADYCTADTRIFGPPPPLSLSHSRNLSVLSSRFDQPTSLPLSADVI